MIAGMERGLILKTSYAVSADNFRLKKRAF